jgi:hypothetical protein
MTGVTGEMDRRRFALILDRQVARLAELIMNEYGLTDIEAIRALYSSQLYSLLSNERTKLWWLSAYALLDAYKTERKTGNVENSGYLFGAEHYHER